VPLWSNHTFDLDQAADAETLARIVYELSGELQQAQIEQPVIIARWQDTDMTRMSQEPATLRQAIAAVCKRHPVLQYKDASGFVHRFARRSLGRNKVVFEAAN
jgi:hypothetical protein